MNAALRAAKEELSNKIGFTVSVKVVGKVAPAVVLAFLKAAEKMAEVDEAASSVFETIEKLKRVAQGED